MLTTTANKYPFFDFSEIITEPDLEFRSFEALKPVKPGNIIPDFNLANIYGRWQHFFNGAETHGPISLSRILNKPLVIAFYAPEWQNYGTQLLSRLNAIQQEIKANNGNLIIITPTKSKQLDDLVWSNSLSLNFYFDTDNLLAKQFRVFSDNDPTWNRFSGIDHNVPLLSTYVIDTNRQVVYDHVNLDFSESLLTDELLDAVYHASLHQNIKKSA